MNQDKYVKDRKKKRNRIKYIQKVQKFPEDPTGSSDDLCLENKGKNII